MILSLIIKIGIIIIGLGFCIGFILLGRKIKHEYEHTHKYGTPIIRVGIFECYKCEKCGHTVYKDHKPKNKV